RGTARPADRSVRAGPSGVGAGGAGDSGSPPLPRRDPRPGGSRRGVPPGAHRRPRGGPRSGVLRAGTAARRGASSASGRLNLPLRDLPIGGAHGRRLLVLEGLGLGGTCKTGGRSRPLNLLTASFSGLRASFLYSSFVSGFEYSGLFLAYMTAVEG